MRPIIEIKNLSFSYENYPALEKVNLRIEEKDFVAVIGPNGGGKTTLIKIILGIIKPDSGEVLIYGKPPGKNGTRVGYVPQFADFDKSFPITVMEVVLGGLIRSGSVFPWYSQNDYRKAESALKEVGIAEMENRIFGTLSGGQKQRVLIARAIVSNPGILLLDEPTASVDSNVEKDIYELFKKLNNKLTIILVTHDIGFVSRYINRVACVNRFIKVHSPAEVDQNIIEDTYKSRMSIIHHECGL